MNIFDVKNFCASVNCEYNYIKGFYLSCNEFSYSFKSGAYALTGDIYDGSWAFAYSLCPMKKEHWTIDQERVSLCWNGKKVTFQEIEKMTWYVGYYENKKNIFIKNHSVREKIEKAISKNNLKYTSNEIREMFLLSDIRFDRPLNAVGIEMMRASMAIGFCQNKNIFCFPYMGIGVLYDKLDQFKYLFEILKAFDKIVLLPVLSTHLLPSVFDEEVNINQLFFDGLSPENKEYLQKNSIYIKPF